MLFLACILMVLHALFSLTAEQCDIFARVRVTASQGCLSGGGGERANMGCISAHLLVGDMYVC